jgi:ADP-L-glycero-D-manno-heptose 6-epimerase
MTAARTVRTVLVTGASGFIGGHVVAGLAERGMTVVGVDLRDAPADLSGTMSFHRADFTADPILDMVREGRFDAVIHQAAISSTLETDWALLRAVNVDRSLALAEACAGSGTPLVYASSSSVYGRIHNRQAVAEKDVDDRDVCSGPINEYARSKLLFDTILARRPPQGLRWASLRYTNVFGPGEQHKGNMASIISQLLRTVASGGTPTVFADTLSASRDYVPVNWVVQVILRLIESPVAAGTFNVGTGCPISFATILQWCVEFSGAARLPIELVPNPIASRYQYWTCADMRELRRVTALAPPTAEDVRVAALALYQEAAATAFQV